MIKKINQDKRGLVFKNAFFAILIVSVSFVALGVWIDEWNTDYSSSITLDFDDYNKLDEVSNEAIGQEGNISVKSSFNKADDFEGTSLRGVFAVLNDLYRPFRVIFGEGGMLDSLTDRWGMPDYIRQTLVTMMIIAITFAIIAIFFRKPGGQA